MNKNSTPYLIVLITFFVCLTATGYSQSTEGYYVSEAISFEKGFVLGVEEPDRFDPQSALGAPSNAFLSLGYGGEVVFKFAAPVKNVPDVADMRIHETSHNNPPCIQWPEKAIISFSQDNINWYVADTICRTEDVQIPDNLTWVLYVKIKDFSNPDDFSYGTVWDGYDVNSIESLHGWLGPVLPILDCVSNNNDGTYTAFLGYHNQDDLTFSIPIGVRNFFSTTNDIGQPQEFLPGEHVFSFNFDGDPLTWTLKGPDSLARTVTVSSSSQACPVLPTATISGDAIFCESEEEDAEVRIDLTGTAPWTVVYKNSSNVQTKVEGITESPYTFKTRENTTFTLVSVKDADREGTVQGSATITILTAPTASLSAADVCFGEEIVLSSGLSATNDTYNWTTTGTGTLNAQSLNPTYIPGDEESGEVTFTFTIENTCGQFTESITVKIKEQVNADFLLPDKLEAHKPLEFTPIEDAADEYEWSINLDVVSSHSPLTHTFIDGGEYSITLLVTKDGCESEVDKLINVDDTQKALYVPNVFSPWASNPENQVVKVYGVNLSTEGFEFKIVNRWGNVLFETNNLERAQNSGWNGKSNRTGEMQALGVYIYMLKGKFIDGEEFKRTGSVTLLK